MRTFLPSFTYGFLIVYFLFYRVRRISTELGKLFRRQNNIRAITQPGSPRVIHNQYKPHMNRFETNYMGASGHIKKDSTYDSKADWSLRYYNKDFHSHTRVASLGQEGILIDGKKNCAYDEPSAEQQHYRVIGKRQVTTSDNAEFRDGLRNHNYVSPTHFSNTALYGNNREETSAPKN